MSMQLLAICHHVRGITMLEKAVLTALCGYANDDGGSCFPSVDELAADACTTARSVQRALPVLQSSGAIGIEKVPGRSTQYRVSVAWLNAHYVAPKGRRGVTRDAGAGGDKASPQGDVASQQGCQGVTRSGQDPVNHSKDACAREGRHIVTRVEASTAAPEKASEQWDETRAAEGRRLDDLRTAVYRLIREEGCSDEEILRRLKGQVDALQVRQWRGLMHMVQRASKPRMSGNGTRH